MFVQYPSFLSWTTAKQKGGAPSSWDAVKKSPRLEDLWQLHYSKEGGAEHNVRESFIANLSGTDPR